MVLSLLRVTMVVLGVAVCLVLFLPGTQATGAGYVGDELSQARWFARKLYDRGDSVPDTLGEFVDEWRKDGDLLEKQKHPEYCRFLPTGIDPWGQEFIYRYDEFTKILTIRSSGPDKKDDSGKNDDIQKRYDMNSFGNMPKREAVGE